MATVSKGLGYVPAPSDFHFPDGVTTTSLQGPAGAYDPRTGKNDVPSDVEWIPGTNGLSLRRQGQNDPNPYVVPVNVNGKQAVDGNGDIVGYDLSWNLGPLPGAAQTSAQTVQGQTTTVSVSPTPTAPAGPTSFEQVEDPDSPYFGESYTDPVAKTTQQFDPQAAVSVYFWEQQGYSLADANDKAAAAAAKLGSSVIQPAAATAPAPAHPGDTLDTTYETKPGVKLPTNTPEQGVYGTTGAGASSSSGGSGPSVGSAVGAAVTQAEQAVQGWPTWAKLVAALGGGIVLFKIFR